MKKKSVFVLLTCGLCILTLGVSSVYATWRYAAAPPSEQSITIETTMGATDYPDEGLSHTALLEALIGSDKGLNNPDSYLNRQIKLRQDIGKDTLGSMAALQGDQLNELFNSSNENITFIVQSVDENGDGETDFYYIFTTDEELGSNGSPNFTIGSDISPIYRTKVVKNAQGEWETQETVNGTARSAYYSEWLIGTMRRIPSFDPDSWAPQ